MHAIHRQAVMVALASGTLYDVYFEGMPTPVRPVSISIKDFGAVGDGVTLNTKAFEDAIAHARALAKKDSGGVFEGDGGWRGQKEVVYEL